MLCFWYLYFLNLDYFLNFNFYEVLIGFFLGLISGLIPSLHINFVALLINSSHYEKLIALSISYSFFNILPLFYFYLPNYDNIVALNSVYKCKNKRSCLLLTLFGSFFGALFGLLIGTFALYFDFSFLKKFSIFVLLFFFFMLLHYNFLIGLLFGLLGFVILNHHIHEPLFHLFSLGFSLYNFYHHILNSHSNLQSSNSKLKSYSNNLKKIKTKLPSKKFNFKSIKILLFYLLLIFLISLLSSLLLFYPGISSSLGILIITSLYSKFSFLLKKFKLKKSNTFSNANFKNIFFISIGALNSASYAIAPFLLKYNIARNYIALRIQQFVGFNNLDFSHVLFSSLVAISLSSFVFLLILSFLASFKLNLLFIGVIICIANIIFSFYFDGILGILIGFASFILLVICDKRKTPKFIIMNAIIFKVLFSFIFD